jgi:hypothetical protein
MTRDHEKHSECCQDAECRGSQRNNYFYGKHLTPDSFRVEQRFLNERRQLLNRAVHGWGVVYGYSLTPETSGSLRVGTGLALDRVGREVFHVEEQQLELGSVIALDEFGKVIGQGCDDREPDWSKEGCWLLRAHYAEQSIGSVDVYDACKSRGQEWDRTCETVRFSLQWIPCAKCCEQPTCQWSDGCGSGPCCCGEVETVVDGCDGQGAQNPATQASPTTEVAHLVHRGGCRSLCDQLTGLAVDIECRHLTEIKEACGRVRIDLHNGIPLACVKLRADDCGKWGFDSKWIETCGPRRLVKRNDALFDLLQGCDLTRIVETGWASFHRKEVAIQWSEFKSLWKLPASVPTDCDVDPVDTELWVRFSRPVRRDTVRVDCFAITVTALDTEGGWREPLRVPIVDIKTEPATENPAKLITKAAIVVNGNWAVDAIASKLRRFNCEEAIVEIEVRCDFIIDCNGQAVDANAVGTTAVPTGNGTPGGTYLSTFRVQKS